MRMQATHGAVDYGIGEVEKVHKGGVIRVALDKSNATEYHTPMGFMYFQIIIQKNENGKDSLIVPYRIDYSTVKDSAHHFINKKLFRQKHSFIFDMKKSISIAQILSNKFWCLDRRYFDVLSNHLQNTASGYFEFEQEDGAKDETVDDIAVICVHGTMSARGDWCSEGTKDIAQAVRDAEKSPEINAIVLDVDTYGGSVDAIQELYEAVKKCSKPVVAIANDNMHSAGYWASCAADYIYANTKSSSFIGSIGVFMTHVDMSERDKLNGVAYTYVTASQSTHKVVGNMHAPLSEEDRAILEAEATEICADFIADVQSVRKNLPAECFTGQSFSGKRALELGLVDAIGTMEQAKQKAKNLAMRKRVA
jgi:protease-4